MKKLLSTIILFLFVIGGMGGCVGLDEYMRTNAGITTLELSVKLVTSRAIRENPEFADNIKAITSDAIALVDENQEITLEELELFIKGKIDYTKITIEEEIAVDTLIKYIRVSTEGYVSDNLPDVNLNAYGVPIKDVLVWINEVATRYTEIGE